MRRAAALASSLAALLLAPVLTGACSGKDPYNPGTTLGIFQVSGQLVTNECAPADLVPNPWQFDVKLSRDASILYWIQGGLPVSGHLDAASHASMSSTSTQEVRAADAKTNASGCTLQRDDALDTTLGANPVAAFTGTLTYTFSQTSDSDCSDQLAANGGGFTNLPCKVSYTLAGTKTALTTLPTK